jgi:hypothetical protein
MPLGLTFQPLIPLWINAARSLSSVLLFPLPLTDFIIWDRETVSLRNLPLRSVERSIFSITRLTVYTKVPLRKHKPGFPVG